MTGFWDVLAMVLVVVIGIVLLSCIYVLVSAINFVFPVLLPVITTGYTFMYVVEYLCSRD